MGIRLEEAMATIHAIRNDGSVVTGTGALRAMFDEVGLGWAAAISDWPLFAQVMRVAGCLALSLTLNVVGLGRRHMALAALSQAIEFSCFVLSKSVQ